MTGGIFKLELFLPDDYPMAPPKIRFLTNIYHPNIDKLGRICPDVLQSMLTFRCHGSPQQLTVYSQLVARSPDPHHSPVNPGTPRRSKPEGEGRIIQVSGFTTWRPRVRPSAIWNMGSCHTKLLNFPSSSELTMSHKTLQGGLRA
jgi:hypothetical protein